MTIYIIYFITVAVLGTAIFRLFEERDFWQGEFLDSSAAHVAELEARIHELVTEKANLLAVTDPDDLERRLDASSKRIEALYAHFDQD